MARTEDIQDDNESDNNDVVVNGKESEPLDFENDSGEHFYSGDLSLTKLHLIIEYVYLPLLGGSTTLDNSSDSTTQRESGLQVGLNIDFMTRTFLTV